MGEVGAFQPDNKIGEMLVSSRSLAEYRAMFALTDTDLTRSILDCPGGAASFTAEVTSAGGRARACDPIYGLSTELIVDRSLNDIQRAQKYQRQHPDEYVWTFFTDPEHYLESRTHSVGVFGDHRDAWPHFYSEAKLPTLPFLDGTFDLALSSHLLFAYADRFTHDFHLRSIRELVRIAAEVRVFPLVPFGFSENPALPVLIDQLNQEDLVAEKREVAYELQRGANMMLRIVRR